MINIVPVCPAKKIWLCFGYSGSEEGRFHDYTASVLMHEHVSSP